jgi:hypothetical protein
MMSTRMANEWTWMDTRGWKSALVAGVVATCHSAVATPGTAAEPAEFVAALCARHVHAALILLDVALALGTCLCVSEDPRDILSLCRVLDVPLFHRIAVNWPVRFLLAGKAVCLATFAVHVERPAQGNDGNGFMFKCTPSQSEIKDIRS